MTTLVDGGCYRLYDATGCPSGPVAPVPRPDRVMTRAHHLPVALAAVLAAIAEAFRRAARRT